jgi:signal peptidase I
MDDNVARRRVRICAAVIAVVALTLGALATRFLFAAVDMRTDGMTDALMSGDVAMCLRMDNPLWPLEIRRGALALVRYEEQGLKRLTVRRLIALAGDEIWVDDEGRVTLNGEALEEPYATYCYEGDQVASPVIPGGALENPFADPDAPAPAQENPYTVAEGTDDMDYPLTVPEGSAFVLCDNRNNRLDSRSSRFGLVKEADIRGVARAIIWPVYRAGLLEVAPAVG